MNRSVVTHHCTAWWRSHRATSRWTAGSERRHGSGRGGNRVARATLAGLATALAYLQPDQKTVGQHHRDRVPVEAGPEATLILVPSHLPFGLLMEPLDGIAPMGIPGQLFQCGSSRQVAPVELPLLRLASGGPLPDQPAFVPLPATGHPPAAYRHELLAQPPFGALPPANCAPLPTGDGVQQLVRPPHWGHHLGSYAHLEVCPHRDHIRLLPCLQARQ